MLHFSSCGHDYGAFVTTATFGMSLLIVSNLPTFTLGLMFKQVIWHAIVEPTLSLRQ
jgi:hypothetical protein